MGLSFPISSKPETSLLQSDRQTPFLGASNVKFSTLPKLKIEMSNHCQTGFKLPMCVYLMDDKFLRLPKIHEMIVTLRGGENYWRNVILKNLTFLCVVYLSLQTGNMCEGFLNQPPPGCEKIVATINIIINSILDEPDHSSIQRSTTALNAHEPMKTEADRAMPHKYDIHYTANKNHPALTLGFLQVKHKLPSQGAIWGVNFRVKSDKNNNLSTVSPNTEQNALIKRDGIDSMIRSETTDWYLNGDYQPVQSARSMKVHIAFSKQANRVIIFKALNCRFVSSFEPTLGEMEELLTTGNFKTEHAGVPGPKNKPPVVPFISLSTRPIQSNENSESAIESKKLPENPGIKKEGRTELRTFDNDVKLISPVQD